MATIHFHEAMHATPEQFVAALTDFGPGRSQLFPKSDDGYLQVHDQSPVEADVTEGSHGIWERLHYDVRNPEHVVLKTTDSNVWGGRSGHTYTLTRQPDGTTDVDVVIRREGKNVKGRLLAAFLGTVGQGALMGAFDDAVTVIDARAEQELAGATC
jgi:hypothetical protein